MKQPNGLRFESREIAVILSLFIFVSLLMFTVGIVIGKGLAQAKFEGEAQSFNTVPESPLSNPSSQPQTSSSVSINSPVPHLPSVESKISDTPEIPAKLDTLETPEADEPLKLQPKTQSSLAVREEQDKWELGSETESLLDNPMIRDLFEEKSGVAQAKKQPSKKGDIAIERDFSNLQAERSTASLPAVSGGASSGPYSVQIAAYSEKSQAEERVESLKKMGYSHAYFSSVNLGENKETWFRVWLGYYPSFESAKSGGKSLQARGEVKNFLVRKTQKSDSAN